VREIGEGREAPGNGGIGRGLRWGQPQGRRIIVRRGTRVPHHRFKACPRKVEAEVGGVDGDRLIIFHQGRLQRAQRLVAGSKVEVGVNEDIVLDEGAQVVWDGAIAVAGSSQRLGGVVVLRRGGGTGAG